MINEDDRIKTGDSPASNQLENDDKGVEGSLFVDAAFDTNEGSLSQTGYMIVLGGCMIYARSGKQTVVAQASAEAEYMAAAEASNAAIGIQETVNEIFEQMKERNSIKTIEMYSDNSAAIEIASGHCQSTIKHIRRHYHVLRQRVINGELIIHHLKTDYQPADALTKSLENTKYKNFRDQILGYSIAGQH